MKYSDMSVNEIKGYVAKIDLDGEIFNHICDELKSDKRKSVRSIAEQLSKRKFKWESEKDRLEKMYDYESRLFAKGIKCIAGIDEVGRGPLSGPVVSAAVVLPNNCVLPGLNDSKKLNETNRLRLYREIVRNAIDVSVGMASHVEIDKLNILNATKLSMQRAVFSLETEVQHLLVDAITLDKLDIEQTAIVKGDQKSASIAAASIVAKVTRDSIMTVMSRYFNEYGFERNKGYGTAEHIAAIRKYGISPIHRKSFVRGIRGGDIR